MSENTPDCEDSALDSVIHLDLGITTDPTATVRLEADCYNLITRR